MGLVWNLSFRNLWNGQAETSRLLNRLINSLLTQSCLHNAWPAGSTIAMIIVISPPEKDEVLEEKRCTQEYSQVLHNDVLGQYGLVP